MSKYTVEILNRQIDSLLGDVERLKGFIEEHDFFFIRLTAEGIAKRANEAQEYSNLLAVQEDPQ